MPLALSPLALSPDFGKAGLSGALGVNTLLLLPEVSDWRWQIRGEDSLWYHSIRLFRKRNDNWNETLEELNNYIINTNLRLEDLTI